MAELNVFNQLRYRVGLGFDWTTATVHGLLVDSDTWTPDVDDDYIQSVLTAGADEMAGGGYARQAMTGKTVTLDDTNDRALWDGSSLDFGSVTGTDPYDTLILANIVTNDADSWLIGWWDLGAQAADSAQILFVPHADGWIQWPIVCPGS